MAKQRSERLLNRVVRRLLPPNAVNPIAGVGPNHKPTRNLWPTTVSAANSSTGLAQENRGNEPLLAAPFILGFDTPCLFATVPSKGITKPDPALVRSCSHKNKDSNLQEQRLLIQDSQKTPTTDGRLPNGEWTGFYLENHRKERSWMHLYLEFAEAQLRGEGTDYVGPWRIEGTYDLEQSLCRWTKTYFGKHAVQYHGKLTESGIEGIWSIRNWNRGPFHIWPQSRSDLTKLFLTDDLENRGTSQFLGSQPNKPASDL